MIKLVDLYNQVIKEIRVNQPGNPYKQGSIKYQILQLLFKNGPMTWKAIIEDPSLEALGVGKYDSLKLSYHVNKMLDDGTIEKLSKGIYGRRGATLDTNKEQDLKNKRTINTLKNNIRKLTEKIERINNFIEKDKKIGEFFLKIGKIKEYEEGKEACLEFAKQNNLKHIGEDYFFPSPFGYGDFDWYNFHFQAKEYYSNIKDLERAQARLDKLEPK